MVTPGQWRTAVTSAMKAADISERRACRFTGFSRSSQRYATQAGDDALRERLQTLAVLRPRWGYRRLCRLLRREGVTVNLKRVQRVYREAGLSVRRRPRKRVAVERVPRSTPSMPVAPNIRWSMDFVSDALADGRKFRAFSFVDDFSRECPVIAVDRSLPGERVVRELEQVAQVRGYPQAIVCDNGPEFRSEAMDQWAHQHGVTLQFIEPDKPVPNCFIQSFNGRLRHDCLNESWFVCQQDAQRTIETFRLDYNDVRPHSSLTGCTPNEFVRRQQQKSMLHYQSID